MPVALHRGGNLLHALQANAIALLDVDRDEAV
jgi:hypothetical protein